MPPHTLHRFYNNSGKSVRFLVVVTPGHPGFENALRIAYGLASDDEVYQEGTPKNLLALAYLVQLSGSKLPGVLSLLQPVFGLGAKIAHHRGLDKRLAEKYLQPF